MTGRGEWVLTNLFPGSDVRPVNDISDGGAEHLARALRANSTLTWLNLRCTLAVVMLMMVVLAVTVTVALAVAVGLTTRVDCRASLLILSLSLSLLGCLQPIASLRTVWSPCVRH